ncbi:hypothetical protein ACLMJK_006636 [Lecanora helva]
MAAPQSRPQNDAAHTNLPRARSIQFTNPNASMSRSISPTSRPEHNESQQYLQQQSQTESSADEITPIVTKERGTATKNKNYDTTTTKKTSDNGTGTSRRSSASSNAATRRRKGSSASGGPAATSTNAPAEPGGPEEAKDEKPNWFRDLLDKYGSVELDNKGSVARDHLALERTFLAWLRTSLAFASIGIAITQLFRLNTTISEREGLEPHNPPNTYHLRQVGKPLGATFLGIAILVLLVGGRRYFESQYWIIRGKFPASRGSVFLITFVALTLIVTSLIVVCVVDSSVFEKK